MEMNKKVQMGIILVSLMVFGYGFFLWVQALCYQPRTPESLPYRHDYKTKITMDIQPGQYQALRDGRLFFGESAPVSENRPVFQTKLVLWGITGGKNSRAVVGLDPKSNAQTMIVKPGDRIGGETVAAIGKDFIVVKNVSGEGRVDLRD